MQEDKFLFDRCRIPPPRGIQPITHRNMYSTNPSEIEIIRLFVLVLLSRGCLAQQLGRASCLPAQRPLLVALLPWSFQGMQASQVTIRSAPTRTLGPCAIVLSNPNIRMQANHTYQ